MLAAEKWRINSTQFSKLEAQRHFHWITRVTAARLFSSVTDHTGALTLAAMAAPSEKLLLLGFDVHWSATVKTDGRFFNAEVLELKLAEQSFDEATPDDLKRWRLRSEESPPS